MMTHNNIFYKWTPINDKQTKLTHYLYIHKSYSVTHYEIKEFKPRNKDWLIRKSSSDSESKTAFL